MQQTELTEFENKKVKKEILKMISATELSFSTKNDMQKTIYLLLSSKIYLKKYLNEVDVQEKVLAKIVMQKQLSQYMKEVFGE